MLPPTTSTSFFEYVGIAGLERLNTQVLAWIFSDSCNALPSDEKVYLLNRLFRLYPPSNTISQVLTEDQYIDLVIKTDNHTVIVENKLKSDEHGNQLQKIEKKASAYGQNLQFFYLTLLENDATRELWHPVSYNDLYRELDQSLSRSFQNGSTATLNSFDVLLLKGYFKTLRDLLATRAEFLKGHRSFPNVFLDGHTKKSVKAERSLLQSSSVKFNHYQNFITRNNLETTFQRLFYKEVFSRIDLQRIPGYKWLQIGETRGVGLFEVASDIVLNSKEHEFEFRVQIQGNTVKLNFQAPGKGKEVIAPFLDTFRQIKAEGLTSDTGPYTRLNTPRSTAYVSFSKKLARKGEGYWFDAHIDQLAERFRNEIESGFKVARELLPRLASVTAL